MGEGNAEPKITSEQSQQEPQVGQTNEIDTETYDYLKSIPEEHLTDEQKQAITDYEKTNTTVKNENPVSETNAENIPADNNDVEAKKADIERRRQEELSNHKSSVIKSTIFKSTDLDGEQVFIRVEHRNDGQMQISISKDGKEFSPIDHPKDKIGRISDENYAKGVFGNNVENIGEGKTSNKLKEINAKYDVELAALAAPVSDIEAKKADIEKVQKYTLNKANKDLPQAFNVPFAIIDKVASGLEDLNSSEVKQVKLLEIRGRNSEGKLVGTVWLQKQDGTSETFEVKFDDAELAALEGSNKADDIPDIANSDKTGSRTPVKDYDQNQEFIRNYRKKGGEDIGEANKEFLVGLRQVEPSNSLANRTDAVEVVEVGPNAIRYE